MANLREYKKIGHLYKSGRIEMSDYEMGIKIRLEAERLFGK